MKFLLQLLFLSLPILANAQLERTWVSVESRESADNSTLNGIIYDFQGDILRIRNVFSDSTIVKKYVYENDQIIVNDTVFLNIQHLSEDSLIAKFPWITVVFFPTEPNDIKPDLTLDDLIGVTWTLKHSNYSENWNFTDRLASDYPLNVSKNCVRRNVGNWTMGDIESWNLLKFDNHLFLTTTRYQFEQEVFKVFSFHSGIIRLSPINKKMSQDVELTRHPILNQAKLDERIRILTSRTWKTQEIIQYQSGTDRMNEMLGDSVEADDLLQYSGSYSRRTDTLLISQQQFLDKSISYRFDTEGTYCILLNNQEYDCGTWELLKDGRAIKLDEGWQHELYINIERIYSETLELANCNRFSTELGSSEYLKICYTIQLE